MYSRQQSSPLRQNVSHDPYSAGQSSSVSTEIRRGQELLRQIRNKENELASRIAQGNQTHVRFEPFDSSQLMLQTTINGVEIDQNRKFEQKQNFATMPEELNNMKSIFNESRNSYESQRKEQQKSNSSPLRELKKDTSFGTSSIQQQAIQIQQSQNSDISQQRFIEKLHNDNTTLQKRLQLVVAELERVMKEKDRVQSKLGLIFDQTEEVQREINLLEQDDQETLLMNEQLQVERQSNKTLRQTITDSDKIRVETLKLLRTAQNSRDRDITECEDLNVDLKHKVRIVKELEMSRLKLEEKLEKLQQEIQLLQSQLLEDDKRNNDLQRVIDVLLEERNNLMNKLEELSKMYDHTVQDLQNDRRKMENHERLQRQILAAKTMFQTLEIFVKQRKQSCVNEFFLYCRFDEKCHRTLKNFSKVLENIGTFKQKIAIKFWYQRTFKPLSVDDQTVNLNENFYTKKLRQRMFSLWKARCLGQLEFKQNCSQALFKLWSLTRRQLKNDKLRMFQAWRDQCLDTSQQHRLLRSILITRFNNARKVALYKWIEFSIKQKALVRYYILATKIGQKRQLSLILGGMREAISVQKSKRQNRLLHFFKAWGDYIQRKKYLAHQKLQMSELWQKIQERALASCFQELRLHKEHQKFELMNETWTQKIEPEIAQLNNDIRMESTQGLLQKKIRALNFLSKIARSYLYSYLEQWRLQVDIVNEKLNKNLKAIITRKYRQTLHWALAKIRDGKQQLKLRDQRKSVISEETSQLDLQNEIISLTNLINDEQFKLGYQQRLVLTHSINIFNRRTQMQGLSRFKKKCRTIKQLQNAALTLMENIKVARYRSCWAHYQKQIELCRKGNQLERIILKRQVLREWRTKRQIFSAIQTFYNNFLDQQTYWKITLTNLEVYLKRRTVIKWISQASLKKEQLLKASQNQETKRFDEVNQELGSATTDLARKVDENQQLKIELLDQGQRILSNVFARYYYIRAQRGFQKWSKVISYQKHRELLIKSMAQHTNASMFYVVKAAFQNWIAKTKIKETQEKITQTQMHNDETNQLILFQKQQFESTNISLQNETNTNLDVLNEKNRKLEQTLQIMTRLNKDNYFQSKKRLVFLSWATYYRKYKQFAQTIKNVISKSIWQNGFDKIRFESNSIHVKQLQNNHITSIKRLFWQKNCGSVIQQWKDSLRTKHNQVTSIKLDSINKITQQHSEKVQQITKINNERVSAQVRDNRKTELFKTWQLVTQWQKTARITHLRFQETCLITQARNSLQLWVQRKQTTFALRNKLSKFKLKYSTIYKKGVFQALKASFKNAKDFCGKLSTMGSNFDRMALMNAFQWIRQFSKHKVASQKKIKIKAADSLCKLLKAVFLKNSRQNLSRFRVGVALKSVRHYRLKNVMSHLHSSYVRKQFLKWRNQVQIQTTLIDVNTFGPVVEEVLDAQADFENCRNFMKDQGYTKVQIEEVTVMTKDRAKTALSRSVARLQHFTDQSEMYLKPKMFDRWRQYVKVKKLVRFLLRNIENRLKPINSDLSIAFNRWKVRHQGQSQKLSGLDRNQLIQKVCDRQEILRKMDREGTSKQAQLTQMSFERDELIDNLVRSQKLGIAAGRNNLERSMAKSLKAMSDHAYKMKATQLESVLKRNIELITGLKDKIMHLEFENTNLANDNEELRQFSLDGFEIARSAQVLSDEREKLSIDLADKAKTIKRLLDEHENYERSLRETQYKTEELIQKTLRERQSTQHHK